jgi:hypothetical protein
VEYRDFSKFKDLPTKILIRNDLLDILFALILLKLNKVLGLRKFCSSLYKNEEQLITYDLVVAN